MVSPQIPTLLRRWLAGCAAACHVLIAFDLRGDSALPTLQSTNAQHLLLNILTDERQPGPWAFRSLIHRAPLQWTIESRQLAASLGSAVTGGGDLNGDGANELILGAGAVAGPWNERSRLLILTWTPGQDHPAFLDQLRVSSLAVQFGNSVASGWCDVNGDGLYDLLIGTPPAPGSEGSRIHAMLFLGRSSLRLTEADWVLHRNWPAAGTAIELAVAGDIDGDGLGDALMSVPNLTDELTEQGIAALFLGTTNGLSRRPVWKRKGTNDSAQMGLSIAGAADFNGDGHSDVAIARRIDRSANGSDGLVDIYHGSPEGLRPEPARVLVPSWPQSRFGNSLACPGDLNADGYDDLLVGAPGRPRRTKWPGLIAVFYGGPNGVSDVPNHIIQGETAGSRFGAECAGTGDVNGDGLADFLVAATTLTDTAIQQGRVYLFLGTPQGPPVHPSWIMDGPAPYARFGSVLASVGDLDRDGLGDFAVGTPYLSPVINQEGRVDVFFGDARAYAADGAFPADGINSIGRRVARSGVGGPASEQPILALAPSGPATDRSSTGPGWWIAAMSLPVGLGLWLWLREYRRQLELATRKERARIARDLHDDLGSRLALLSLQQSSGAEPKHAGAEPMRELLRAMDEIVWAVDPANDTLENLISYVATLTDELFAHTPVRCFTDLPEHIPPHALNSGTRKQLLLAVKEALTNAMRHADAKRVDVRIRFAKPWLEIVIEDDGCGFSAVAAPGADGRRGHGLRHMKERMQELGGRVTVQSRPRQGTRIEFAVPLA